MSIVHAIPTIFPSLQVGDRVQIYFPNTHRVGEAALVDKIPARSIPREENILLWYGKGAPRGAFDPQRTDRYVFYREDVEHYTVIPDSPASARLVRRIAQRSHEWTDASGKTFKITGTSVYVNGKCMDNDEDGASLVLDDVIEELFRLKQENSELRDLVKTMAEDTGIADEIREVVGEIREARV